MRSTAFQNLVSQVSAHPCRPGAKSCGASRAFRKTVKSATRQRTGFSLIEVMIATAILMGSAIVLARLAGMGREQSQKAKLYSDTQQLCEQTMNELLLGMRLTEPIESMPLLPLPKPLEEVSEELTALDPFAAEEKTSEAPADETNPEWRHSIRMELLPAQPGMWALTLEVMQGDQTLPRPVRFSLTRWIAGPIPEGAFDELSSGQDDPSAFQQGGLL